MLIKYVNELWVICTKYTILTFNCIISLNLLDVLLFNDVGRIQYKMLIR